MENEHADSKMNRRMLNKLQCGMNLAKIISSHLWKCDLLYEMCMVNNMPFLIMHATWSIKIEEIFISS